MINLIDFPPPPQYDYPYKGFGATIVEPLGRVQQLCTAIGVVVASGHIIYGCSWHGPAGCTIIIPAVDALISRSDQTAISRVENANCNGWPKDGRE